MTLLNKVVNIRNLQLFAEGGATAGATSGTVTTSAGDTTTSLPAEDKSAKPKIVYGKQNTENPVSEEKKSTSQTEQRKSFAELIKSEEYADEAQKFIKDTFNKRFSKKYGRIAEDNEKMRKILEMQNYRYGLDTNSDTYLDDIYSKIESDTKLFEEQALEQGMTPQEFLKVKNAERIIEQNRIDNENRLRNESVNNHIQNLMTQAEQMKAEFPNFDLEREMQNPKFKSLVDTPELGGIGFSVRDAFVAVHHDEITKASLNNAINQAVMSTANSVSTNKSRPVENGLSKMAPVIVKDDPSKLTLEDFEKIDAEYRRTGKSPIF